MAFIGAEGERRKFRRVRIDTPIKYKLKLSNDFGSTLARDISSGGLRIILDKFVPKNTDFVLEITPGNLPNSINAVGRVAWTQKFPYAERYQIGLEFQEINGQQRRDVIDYVNSRQI